MGGLARHVSAALVVIAMIAAQIMPAWAGCHSRAHAARTMAATMVSDAMPVHHGMDHRSMASDAQVKADRATTGDDPATPSPNDRCLGNCGCACSLSAALVLGTVVAIDTPLSITISRDVVSTDLLRGRTPDSPRRPPRLIA